MARFQLEEICADPFCRLRADTWILNQDWILNPESKENTAYMPTLPDTTPISQSPIRITISPG